MPKKAFETLSDTLVEFAENAVQYFNEHGYTVRVEKHQLGFPFTPTLICKRQSTAVLVEVIATIDWTRVKMWCAYARSSGKDTRIAFCLPNDTGISGADEDKLRAERVGLYVTSAAGTVERIAPNDLGLNVALPPLGSLPKGIRKVLGSAYEQFERSQWREGFEDACQALEREARRYLKSGMSSRIKIVTKKGSITLTAKQVDKLTMGQLAERFAAIQTQNHADGLIGQALKTINRDRVGVAHHKAKKITEKRLRANVGSHMWTIVAALKLM